MINIIDHTHMLNDAQVQALQAKAAAYPFQIQVLLDVHAPNKPSFEHAVATLVSGPNTLAIGIDPDHHFTYVRGSADLGLPNGPEVASAGNRYFKQGDLVTGIDSIAARANDLRVTAKLVSSQTGAPIVVHEHKTAPAVWWLLGGGVVVTVVVLAYLWLRNRKRERELMEQTAAAAEEAAELRARNLEEETWHDKAKASRSTAATPAMPIRKTRPGREPWPAPPVTYVAPVAPQPPIVVQPPNNSALDMLVGYEIGRDSARSEPRVVEREVAVKRSTRDDRSSSWSSSSDSSSSSSWDSSSSSSSSSDWGGGSDSGSSGGGSDW